MRKALIFVIVVLAAGVARADEQFVATLSPTPRPGAMGSGTASLTLSSDETQISYNITVSGLSGTEVGAHIHRPDGSIAYTLPLGSPKIGVWNNPGLIDIFSLRGEQMFILVHTDNFPAGEVRGNIMVPVPVEDTTWGRIKAVYLRP